MSNRVCFFCQLITYFCCVSFWVKNRIVPVFFVGLWPFYPVSWCFGLIFFMVTGFLPKKFDSFFFYWKRSTIVGGLAVTELTEFTEFYFRGIFLLRFCWCCRVTFHYVRLVDLRNYRQLSNGLGLNSSVEPCSSFILFLSSYYRKISKRGLKKNGFTIEWPQAVGFFPTGASVKKKNIFLLKKTRAESIGGCGLENDVVDSH